MIVTVTLNPSLDRTLSVSSLVRGEVVRADSTQEDPAGKGVNVARALSAHGTEAVAVLPGLPIDDEDLQHGAGTRLLSRAAPCGSSQRETS